MSVIFVKKIIHKFYSTQRRYIRSRVILTLLFVTVSRTHDEFCKGKLRRYFTTILSKFSKPKSTSHLLYNAEIIVDLGASLFRSRNTLNVPYWSENKIITLSWVIMGWNNSFWFNSKGGYFGMIVTEAQHWEGRWNQWLPYRVNIAFINCPDPCEIIENSGTKFISIVLHVRTLPSEVIETDHNKLPCQKDNICL